MRIVQCPPLALISLAVLLTTSTAFARSSVEAPKAKILRSRTQVRNVAGKKIANEIPVDFDFQLYALLWLAFDANPEATAKIVTLPAGQGHIERHSPSTLLSIVRKRRSLEVTISYDLPCSGGMQKAPKALEQCLASVTAGEVAAKRTVVLFATPRAKLRRVRVKARRAQPRP